MTSLSKFGKTALESIGNTPLVKLNNGLHNISSNINVFCKLEYFNPTGSIKDRMINYVMNKLLQENKINKDSVIIEASSGNTGASISMIASSLGVKSIVATNTSCSQEKQNIIKAFGAELIVTKSGVPPDSPEHYQNVIENMYKNDNKHNKYVWIDQYNNLLNYEAFYNTLGPEIYNEFKQSHDKVDYFVASSSTGGTITGIGKYLKKASHNHTKVWLADPIGSILGEYILDKSKEHIFKSHLIEGAGKDSIPNVFYSNQSVIDNILKVNDVEAIKMCHFLSKYEGLFVGGSGAMNILAAINLAKQLEKTKSNKDKINIVTVVPDGGFKYLSKYYNPEWCQEKKVAMQ